MAFSDSLPPRPPTPCRLSLIPLDPAAPRGPVREWRLDFAGGHVCGARDAGRGPMSREGALHMALDWAAEARYAVDPDSLPVDGDIDGEAEVDEPAPRRAS